MDFKGLLDTKEYEFLKTNEHLGSRIILLGVGGSYSYGTNIEGSDIDIRGVALNSRSDILGLSSFDHFCNEATDTTIYSFNKVIQLLLSNNPNVIEMFGLKPEHYLLISAIGQELLDNKKMFLSRNCINSFGGYANQQLTRLKNGISVHRNNKRDEPHLNKHMMHLIRLYMMCLDLLEKGDIITFRTVEHELLMAIRNGEYMRNSKIINDFWYLLNEYQGRFEYAKNNTSLPDKPDMKKVEEFVISVNERSTIDLVPLHM
jgi:predicted nucleotidyltransferase